MHAGSNFLKRRLSVLAVVALVGSLAIAATATSASATSATYSATYTVPVAPASNFAGSGGGDGWAVALSSTAVYNVFHHSTSMTLACHLQSNANECFTPETITDTEGHGFATSGHPGMYLDQGTGKLYVYGTRTSDETAGVVCIDTTIATTNPNPFCGFTALTPVGHASRPDSISGASAPMLIGNHWYAFNFVNGVGASEGENELMCFDVSTDAACAGQPFSVALGAGSVSDGGFPSPATAAIGSKVIIPVDMSGTSRLACFDDATQSSCAGSWPVSLSFSYASANGAPFPLLDATGKLQGLCLPTGTDQCFNLAGEETTTPAGMPAVIGASDPWNGPAFVLGPRIYVPNGNVGEGIVQCFDYSTGASCTNFPKSFNGLGYLYTVNADPQRPTCIWVNSDDGSQQIQNFDAYTGAACGEGTIRVLASQFMIPTCTPTSYVSIQVLKPAPGAYTSGSVAFDDGDGNPIGLPEAALDGTGTASLVGLSLNTPTGLPQFVFTLNGTVGGVGTFEVKLTWVGDTLTCGNEKIVTPTTAETKPTTTAKGAVLSFGSAKLASTAKACVASSGYTAKVSGKLIASVTYTLDGHKLKTLTKANSHGVYALHIGVKSGHIHHLTIKVTYTSASASHSATLHKILARCAAAKKPRFTG